MTAPFEAYVSVLARDLYRAIKDRSAQDPSSLAIGDHRGVTVIVAKGPIAAELRRAFEEATGGLSEGLHESRRDDAPPTTP